MAGSIEGACRAAAELPESGAEERVQADVLGSAVLKWPSQCSHRGFLLLRSSLVVKVRVGQAIKCLSDAHLLDTGCGATDC